MGRKAKAEIPGTYTLQKGNQRRKGNERGRRGYKSNAVILKNQSPEAQVVSNIDLQVKNRVSSKHNEGNTTKGEDCERTVALALALTPSTSASTAALTQIPNRFSTNPASHALGAAAAAGAGLDETGAVCLGLSLPPSLPSSEGVLSPEDEPPPPTWVKRAQRGVRKRGEE